ncbi:MAG TPA: DNA-directed RNA polymerase subunit alpha C-terminal domain-containing protein [Anaerolineales bacterium]|nr:DNA-directed RNA polymerase subunit alpha C-terminal domain-containing protein [Anaerolineales bacterium]
MTARQTYVDTKKAREAAKKSPERPIGELGLSTRSTEALTKAGITEVNQLLKKLSEGEAAVLAIEGFGQKSLIDAKKKLRALGYELPEASAAETSA